MSKYPYNGLELPSITTIIADCTSKPALVQWSANLAAECVIDFMFGKVEVETTKELIDIARYKYKEVSKEAREVGSAVHSAIQAYLTIGKAPWSPYSFSEDMVTEFNNAMDAFLKFEKDYELEMIDCELTVYAEDEGWAGTLDITCRLNGKSKIYVIDFKTSKAIYLGEMGAQIAAYRSCVPEAEGSGILRLDKATGEYQFKDTSKRHESDLAVFKAMVNLYMLKHPIIRRKSGR